MTGYGDTEGRASLIKRFFNFFFRPSIAKKILFGHLSLAALIILISVFALSSLERLNKINESIIQRDALVIEATDKMIDNLLAQQLYGRRYAILKSSAILALFWERSKEFDRIAGKIHGFPVKHDVSVDRLTSLHMEYNNLFIKGFKYLKNSSSALAQKYNARIENKQEELIRLIKNISSQAQRAQKEKMLMTARIGTTAFRVIGVLCGVGIILGITATILITRNISGSIYQLKRATEEISQGMFEYKSDLQKQDELGELYLAFSEMAQRLKRLERMHLDASPLTRLPGGATIENVLKGRLNAGIPLAFCLLDMDNFKVFNDCYGYARGSEVIKATARIIEAVVAKVGTDEDFIGHIGGDDFVVITSPDRYPEISNAIIERFDKMIVDFYDPGDRDRGGIIARNRQGKEMKFPIMTISIAVVTNQYRELKNPIQIGEIAAELKEHAKSIHGSIYVVDQRTKDD